MKEKHGLTLKDSEIHALIDLVKREDMETGLREASSKVVATFWKATKYSPTLYKDIEALEHELSKKV